MLHGKIGRGFLHLSGCVSVLLALVIAPLLLALVVAIRTSHRIARRLGKPRFIVAGDEGPRTWPNDVRRHVFRRDGVPVRIKVKYRKQDGRTPFANWYRVVDADGATGWQNEKPATGFVDMPYITHGTSPFDQEMRGERLWWPEGEKDVDSITGNGGLAFTFGGIGDRLPVSMVDRCQDYLSGRDIIILPDNDDEGREHAQKKAATARKAGAHSVVVLDLASEFSNLKPKGDVSDLIDGGLTIEQLDELADDASEWPDPLDNTGAQRKTELIGYNGAKAELIAWLKDEARVNPDTVRIWATLGTLHANAAHILLKTIEKGYFAAGQDGKAKSDRRTQIEIVPGQLHNCVAEVEKILIESGEPLIFQRGGSLVHIGRLAEKETQDKITRARTVRSLCRSPAPHSGSA
jgi:hypothetical protein